MITGSPEYEEFLANIAETAPSILKMRVPTNEPIYQIDLDTRKVESPSFVGVEGDHESEYLFFEIDRFYDSFDLADTIGVVTFRNAKADEYYYIIPYYDIYSKSGKIIFPWVVQAPATSYGGTLRFAFKFFKIDRNTRKLLFELNTLVARTNVLVGWGSIQGTNHTYDRLDEDTIMIDSDMLMNINTLMSSAKHLQIYWEDV